MELIDNINNEELETSEDKYESPFDGVDTYLEKLTVVHWYDIHTITSQNIP